jgi:hypothetical protein
MTAQEYSDYQSRFSAFIEREHLSFMSTSCNELTELGNDDAPERESWFSWYPCECCGSHLGGSREYLYARDANDDIVQFIICVDCVYYIEYGRLDDLTMMEVEKDQSATPPNF